MIQIQIIATDTKENTAENLDPPVRIQANHLRIVRDHLNIQNQNGGIVRTPEVEAEIEAPRVTRVPEAIRVIEISVAIVHVHVDPILLIVAKEK